PSVALHVQNPYRISTTRSWPRKSASKRGSSPRCSVSDCAAWGRCVPRALCIRHTDSDSSRASDGVLSSPRCHSSLLRPCWVGWWSLPEMRPSLLLPEREKRLRHQRHQAPKYTVQPCHRQPRTTLYIFTTLDIIRRDISYHKEQRWICECSSSETGWPARSV